MMVGAERKGTSSHRETKAPGRRFPFEKKMKESLKSMIVESRPSG